MTDKSRTPVFDIIDALFMKLGKINARRLAKRDNCDDILLKRESQEKTIYSEAVKSIRIFKKPHVIFVALCVTVALLPMIFVMESYPIPNELRGSDKTWPAAIFLGIQMSITWGFALIFKMTQVRAIFIENAGKETMVQIAKIKAFRRDHFGFKYRDVYTEVTKAREILIPLEVIMLSYMAGIYILSNGFCPYLIASMIQFLVLHIVMVISFSWLFLSVTTIAHCGDHGKKEKEKSKEKKEVMVPDAV